MATSSDSFHVLSAAVLNRNHGIVRLKILPIFYSI